MILITALKRIYHFCFAFFGSVLYGFPSREIFTLGLTGTKGKSTVVELLGAILEADKRKTALLSSTRTKIGEESRENMTENTMPGRFAIQRFLRRAVRAGCSHAIIEVTSQGVIQHRHRFIDFDAALFLNLHPEHIEAHGSFENYRAAKVKFFRDTARFSKKEKKLFFVNDADSSRDAFLAAAGAGGKIYPFSGKTFLSERLGNRRDALGAWFANDFNLENAAAAAKCAEALGIHWETVKSALQSFTGVPGRMEVIEEKPFRVVVDYAHTPDSLLKVYGALIGSIQTTKNKKSEMTGGELICVFGSAGGGRDKWKRPELGRIASRYCGKIILTDEDPYDEPPEEILAHIRAGVAAENFPAKNIEGILNRRDAIARALVLAKRGDTVVITGKGSERFIHAANGRKILWSDRRIAEECLRALTAGKK